MRSTIRVCSGWITSPSPGTSGTPLLRVSPYAKKENFVTVAEAASTGSGVAGGAMGLTATHTGGMTGGWTACCCAKATADSPSASRTPAFIKADVNT